MLMWGVWGRSPQPKFTQKQGLKMHRKCSLFVKEDELKIIVFSRLVLASDVRNSGHQGPNFENWTSGRPDAILSSGCPKSRNTTFNLAFEMLVLSKLRAFLALLRFEHTQNNF